MEEKQILDFVSECLTTPDSVVNLDKIDDFYLFKLTRIMLESISEFCKKYSQSSSYLSYSSIAKYSNVYVDLYTFDADSIKNLENDYKHYLLNPNFDYKDVSRNPQIKFLFWAISIIPKILSKSVTNASHDKCSLIFQDYLLKIKQAVIHVKTNNVPKEKVRGELACIFLDLLLENKDYYNV